MGRTKKQTLRRSSRMRDVQTISSNDHRDHNNNNDPNNNIIVPPATFAKMKRKTENEKSSKRPLKYLRTADSTSNNSSNEVLQNGLILQVIFKHLPTSFLLNSCSLVSKNWNTEARTFIRDNRKCTIATKPLRRCPCSIFKGFDAMCRKMTKAGRVSPFNSFVIKNYLKDCKCPRQNYRLNVIDQVLRSHVKLQYVAIDCQGWEKCGNLSQLFLTLLRLKGNEVKSMKIKQADYFEKIRKNRIAAGQVCLTPLEQVFMSSSDSNEDSPSGHPQFRQLREVTVSYTKFFERASQELFIRSLLKDAPNLKKIVIKDSMALRMPKEKYELMNKCQLSCTNIVLRSEKRDLKCEIFRKQPKYIGDLSMFMCLCACSLEMEKLLQECKFTKTSSQDWVISSETPWWK